MRHLRPAPRAALLGVLALVLAVLAPAPALAGSRDVESGALHWGFKKSFRSYVGQQTAAIPPIGPAPVGERITVSGGASFDPEGEPAWKASPTPPEALPYLFEVTGGSFEDEENFELRSQGAVRFVFPSHHFELTISRLAVVVEDGEARLEGDILQIADEDFGQFEEGEYRVSGGVIGSVGSISVSVDGDALSVRGSGLTVHPEGASALPQEAGEALDDFSLTASFGEELDTGTPTPTPSPSPETGELAWRVQGSSIDLGTAEVTEEGFLATSALPEVLVEDSRAGRPAWRVTAEVTDLAGSAGTIRARHLGWRPTLLGDGGGALAGEAVPPRLASADGTGKGLGVPRVLGSAPRGHAQGSARLGGTLELLAPPSTKPGEYSAVLTITVVG